MFKKIWTGKLSDAEEFIFEAELCIQDSILEQSEEHLIYKSGYYIYIPEIHLNAHEGTFCCKEEHTDKYTPDFSMTILCECNKPADSKEYLYWEQDGVIVTLANYLRDKNIHDISNMTCELYVPEDYQPE